MEGMELLAGPGFSKAPDQDNNHSTNMYDSSNEENETTSPEERHRYGEGLIEEGLRQQMKATTIDLEDTNEDSTDKKEDLINTDDK